MNIEQWWNDVTKEIRRTPEERVPALLSTTCYTWTALESSTGLYSEKAAAISLPQGGLDGSNMLARMVEMRIHEEAFWKTWA